MKKRLYIALILVCLLFTSCQPTPESPTVIKKDNFEGLVKNTAHAWQFKGSKYDSFKRSEETWNKLVKAGLVEGEQPIIEHNESGKTFLVLNALDGSIIDTSYFTDNECELEKTIGERKD